MKLSYDDKETIIILLSTEIEKNERLLQNYIERSPRQITKDRKMTHSDISPIYEERLKKYRTTLNNLTREITI